MSNAEIRAALVAKIESREGKNQYTQSSKRTQVASGYSDCSSLTEWVYQQVMGIDIGDNTEEQMLSSKLYTTGVSISAGIPKETEMLPGDLLYFRGTDTSRSATQYVGHVEMYVGNGEISGHGSGIGPVRKDMKEYCAERQARTSPVPAGNRGLICVRRAVEFKNDSPSTEDSDDNNDTTTSTETEGVSFMRDLVKGDKDYGEIATLQRCLKSLGYYSGAIDHSFGSGTESAVKAFQEAKGISVSYPGTVGPKTWTVLLTQC